MTTEQQLEKIVQKIEDFKGESLSVRDVQGRCSYADYFVFVTGTSSTHIQSMAEELLLMAKKEGFASTGAEGMDRAEWCLIDFGDIIVHLFSTQSRDYFDLESLWSEAPQVEL